MLIIETISKRITDAIEKATGQANAPAVVTYATDAKFGDFQANGAFALAKKLRTNPRQLAQNVVDNLKIEDICLSPEIAGAGFINLRLKPEFVSENLLEISGSSNLGIKKTEKPQTVIVDFSGPNIAKQMHVGHLRSTIIGDCICKIFEHQGHNVIRQNHIGDWGLQMGMLLAVADEFKAENQNSQSKLDALEKLYKQASARYKENKDFETLSRQYTYQLQNHQSDAIAKWQIFRRLTLDACNEIYKFLEVNLTDENVKGESFYTDKLPDVVNDLKKAGLAVESDGAICVFPDDFKTKEGKPLPFIIQKSDGAFLYATTDLAALRYRIDVLKADRIIYVTDARQKLHFEMLFAVAKKCGWVKNNVVLQHITFGSVLGEDGKPFKTRSGENVKLKELLDEAVQRARKVVEEKNAKLDSNEKNAIANAVGIGAVKYADYSNNRASDYVFSFDKMLAMEGNTAPYMQYAYARVKSISRKAKEKGIDVDEAIKSVDKLLFSDTAEMELAKTILKYPQSFADSQKELKPNYITGYLYELSQKFNSFYNQCPVLDADKQTMAARLWLCETTAKVIADGMEKLLGIKIIERM